MFGVLLLCLIGLAVAQQPQPCITPTQWEGNFFDINEQRGVMVRGRLSYDALYHRERLVDEIDVGRNESFYDTISLFDAQIEYVYNFRFRNCTRRPLTRPWRNSGIPATDRSLGEAYVGTSSAPAAGILVTLW
jgi:hypothetical protein